jgi:hypothetical protein
MRSSSHRWLATIAALALVPALPSTAAATTRGHSARHRTSGHVTLPTTLVKDVLSTLKTTTAALRQMKRVVAYASSAEKLASQAASNARKALLAARIPGPEGPIGVTGAEGQAGAAGSAGAPGAPGSAGSDGTAGSDGSAGSSGPAGATGPTGPAGTAGATVASTVTSTTVLNGSSSAALAADCPAGDNAFGGGGAPPDPGADVPIVASSPTSGGTAWTIVWHNASGVPMTGPWTVYAVCVPAG